MHAVIRINENYTKLAASYLFVDIARRVQAFQDANPNTSIIKLGIGDVTRPLPPVAVEALHSAAEELAQATTFRGYGPEQGYAFLRDAVARVDFQQRGINITPDEIFISDGSKCDTGNFQELFAEDSIIAVPDPVYPVYVDTNVMAGRTGQYADGRYEKLVYMAGTRENGFIPPPPTEAVDLLYLCFPNNPTGATASKEQLQAYVDYAREHKALILFDAAYEAFIRDPAIPRSIYEIPGAQECAIEFRSFSKTAGFTGVRCAYTVVPKTVTAATAAGEPVSVWNLWNRRHSTKFNGASYPIQKAAAAIYTDTGQQQVRELTDFYLENATIIRKTIEDLGMQCTGGKNSPYIWVDGGQPSWDLFQLLLDKAAVVTTPGAGFGPAGEGFIRISAFNEREAVLEAMERLKTSFT